MGVPQPHGVARGCVRIQAACGRREAELLQEQRMEEEMERRRLMLNTDAEDILSRRRGENKEVLSQVRGQAQQKKAIIQEEKAADVENARAARFGVSVPAPRDESKDFAER